VGINRRQALTAIAVGASGVLAACAGNPIKGQPEAQAPPSAPQITYKPDIAATDVAPTSQIGIDVDNGWFQRVTLSNPEGKFVAGVFNRDRTSFTTTEPLGYGVVYSWGGAVVGRDGKAVPLAGNFTTVTPQAQVNGQFQLADGQVVGVAVPIIMQFDASISDKASVEKATGRGQLGLAARRGRRIAGALADP
jgi:hypothetical protein